MNKIVAKYGFLTRRLTSLELSMAENGPSPSGSLDFERFSFSEALSILGMGKQMEGADYRSKFGTVTAKDLIPSVYQVFQFSRLSPTVSQSGAYE